MLFDAIRGRLDFESAIVGILACIVIVFLVLPFHEWAHGMTANLLGDKTAKYNGRLTLNPMAHIDLFGSICIFLFGFGWAKPVPVNPNNFKHPKIGMAITAVMGPISNLVAALVGAFIYNLICFINPGAALQAVYSGGLMLYVFGFLNFFVTINIALAVFNLIPIPPLDGSRVLFVCLPSRITNVIYQYEQFFIIGIYILLFVGFLSGPLYYLQSMAYNGIMWLAGLPFGV